VSKNQLEQAFKEFGSIISSDVHMDERGKSKGFGLIIFSRRDDAEEAIKQMDQARFNERVVTVRFDRDQ